MLKTSATLKASPAPKQARTVRTRERIIEGAWRKVSFRGYHKASTAEIAAAARVSQGTLFKHFPTKGLLLATCVEKVLAGFVARFHHELTFIPRGAPPVPPARVETAVAALWRLFRRPEMHAVLEIYVAARTDDDLRKALGPMIDRHRASILAQAEHIFPELAGSPDFASVVDAVVYAMQGVVVGLFSPELERASNAAHLAFFQRLAARELEWALAARKPKKS
jgi:AcrR family transcriptional regulator